MTDCLAPACQLCKIKFQKLHASLFKPQCSKHVKKGMANNLKITVPVDQLFLAFWALLRWQPAKNGLQHSVLPVVFISSISEELLVLKA